MFFLQSFTEFSPHAPSMWQWCERGGTFEGRQRQANPFTLEGPCTDKQRSVKKIYEVPIFGSRVRQVKITLEGFDSLSYPCLGKRSSK